MFRLLLLLCAAFLPLLTLGVANLFDGEHFEELRKDTAQRFRPHNFVAFYKPGECEKRLNRLKFDFLQRSMTIPNRAHALLTKYNIDEQENKWYNFIPELMDLPGNYNVTRCPQILFVHKDCPTYLGGNKWIPACGKSAKWRRKRDGPLRNWVVDKLRYRLKVENAGQRTRIVYHNQVWGKDEAGEQTCMDWVVEPGQTVTMIVHSGDGIYVGERYDESVPGESSWDIINPEHAAKTLVLNDGEEGELPDASERDIQARASLYESRDMTTCTTFVRNHYIPLHIPQFASGTKKITTPQGLQDGLVEFLRRNEKREFIEQWADSQTQMNFAEKTTRLIYLDWEPHTRDYLANQYLKPMLANWVGGLELELTAFYGIREYQQGAWLRGHVDRIDTHVISATITLDRKFDDEYPADEKTRKEEWPLEVVNLDGSRSIVNTEPGTTILYESAKIIHGRPQIFNASYHYGAFAHFRPLNYEGGAWLDFAAKANRALNTNMRFCR